MGAVLCVAVAPLYGTWLKVACASFVKLMQSCSRLLMSKISKPKISRIPMKKRARGHRLARHDRQIRVNGTIQLKTLWYIALLRPSRTFSATSGETGEVIQSEPALMRRVDSAFVNAEPSQRNIFAISVTTDGSTIAASSPEPNETLPSLRTVAQSVHTQCSSIVSKPIEVIASFTSTKALPGSCPLLSTSEDRYLNAPVILSDSRRSGVVPVVR